MFNFMISVDNLKKITDEFFDKFCREGISRRIS